MKFYYSFRRITWFQVVLGFGVLFLFWGCTGAPGEGSGGHGAQGNGGSGSDESAGGASAGRGGSTGGSGGSGSSSAGSSSGAIGNGAVGNGGAGSGAVGNGGAGSGATGTGSGATDSGGVGGTGGSSEMSYALPPADDCYNQFFIEDGCESGNEESTCGGRCRPVNACVDEGKQGEPGFICPRFMLFSEQMQQAARDDAQAYGWSDSGESPFVYGVVGHDPDTGAGRVDEGVTSGTCCQCYQLVPTGHENQVGEDVPLPQPMIVQSFNTQATADSFDVYMAVGGLGNYDACSPEGTGIANLYSSYPMDGQSFGGGIKPVGQFGSGTACKDQYHLVSRETLTSSECQSLVESKCNEITHGSDPSITQRARESCLQGNQPESLYHQNVEVLAKRVACPEALTDVTGCKLADDDLPAVDPAVTTADEASQDSSFIGGYHTTSMEDCCKPTCAWKDNVEGRGKTTVDGYDSFYTCFADGVPLTE